MYMPNVALIKSRHLENFIHRYLIHRVDYTNTIYQYIFRTSIQITCFVSTCWLNFFSIFLLMLIFELSKVGDIGFCLNRKYKLKFRHIYESLSNNNCVIIQSYESLCNLLVEIITKNESIFIGTSVLHNSMMRCESRWELRT